MHHLLIKLTLKNPQHPILVDVKYGKDFLCDWIQMNKMTLIDKPVMHKFDTQINDNTQDGGYSGIALLCESHTSIHTYPENGILYADLFSCNNLDKIQNERFIKEYTKLNDSELSVTIQLVIRN